MSKVFTERQLLERISYLGATQDISGGTTKIYTWSGAETEDDVWVPQSGNRYVISCIVISSVGACTVTLFDHNDDESNRITKVNLAANTVVVIPFPIPRASSDPNKHLQITTSATGGDLTVYGWESGPSVESTTTSVSTSTSSISTTSFSTSSVSQSTSTISTSSYTTSSSSVTTSTISTSSSSHSITYL